MTFRNGILVSLVAAGLLATAPAVHAADPIQDIVERAVPTLKDGTRIPIGEVQRALLQALLKHKFDASTVAPGHITARFEQRWSSFEVDIQYTETAYSVRYKTSRRMDYDEKRQRIDETYNERLAQLEEQVDEQFQVVMQRMKRIVQKQTRRSLKV